MEINLTEVVIAIVGLVFFWRDYPAGESVICMA